MWTISGTSAKYENSADSGQTGFTQIISQQDIRTRVRRFILDNFMYGYDESQLCDDTSFIKIGILDSTGIMEMIELVERDFHVVVKDSEILPENFDSIECITEYISKKLSSREVI